MHDYSAEKVKFKNFILHLENSLARQQKKNMAKPSSENIKGKDLKETFKRKELFLKNKFL